MATSRKNVLALFGLVVSIRAVPAALPEPDPQFGIGPSHYSISWDVPLPVATVAPEDPEPEYPVPVPSDQISLGQPSATVSWEGDPVPTDYPEEPEDPEKPEVPQVPLPIPTNIISLNPPSFSVSWDGPKPPRTTKKPWWPPAWTSPNGYVSASVSWNKRQDEEEPEPTDFPGFPEEPFPEDPEDPEEPNPISFPGAPATTPPNSIGIQPPKFSFSWGKRQEDEPKPTDFPEAENPGEEANNPIGFPSAPPAPPPNSIGIQPSKVSFGWGKRGVGKPTVPVKVPKPPKTTSENWVSWGKRQDDEGSTEVFPPAPTPSDQITLIPPTASISWGIPPSKPSSAYVSWGKRDEDKKHSTTLLTHKTQTHPTITSKPTPVTSSCPTVTTSIIPPCVPPTCPRDMVSCKVGEAEVKEVRPRAVEKTIVTITTVVKPSGKPTPTKSVCTTSTVIVNVGCPTWTCAPRDAGCAL
ncbi:hypothetical protein BU23DRAFT_141273 [Bimuria novae-zelandiae CBS 107.79]|uniref:Uncharacterized protein n=1 Tax=Bimuria novae-zelandiae CBS 107.79 TaxID=1447943 RepID=A0A6A5V6E9_9PLEO|nr:hypothetical protein BU23DRAFT_141273 [Bimuria novae-zelandiae CBS 107.79]